MNALTKHCDVNIDAAFLLLSNRLNRSNPNDIEEISSNALKNFGDDTVFRLSQSTTAETEPALMTAETMTKMEAQALYRRRLFLEKSRERESKEIGSCLCQGRGEMPLVSVKKRVPDTRCPVYIFLCIYIDIYSEYEVLLV